MGFTNNQYIAAKHTDQESHENIHLVTSRVKMNGSAVSDSWDWIRSQDVIRKLEKDFELESVPSSFIRRSPFNETFKGDTMTSTQSQRNLYAR
jgi:hypothetical protein